MMQEDAKKVQKQRTQDQDAKKTKRERNGEAKGTQRGRKGPMACQIIGFMILAMQI